MANLSIRISDEFLEEIDTHIAEGAFTRSEFIKFAVAKTIIDNLGADIDDISAGMPYSCVEYLKKEKYNKILSENLQKFLKEDTTQ